MITGYNTDIIYNGVTYHVQTEDKGLETPLILSLVYDRGTILASKRSPYHDLLGGKFDEKQLKERLHRQHKLICAAIKAGRIEDLKRMNGKQAESAVPPMQAEPNNQNPPIPRPIAPRSAAPPFPVSQKPNPAENNLPPVFSQGSAKSATSNGALSPPPVFDLKSETPIEITDADLIFDETRPFDDVIMLSDEAVEIISDFSEKAEASDHLFIELFGDSIFRGGQSETVSVLVGRGENRRPLSEANVLIKVIGANFRPLIFHAKTDSNGIATVHVRFPPFNRGRAAILLKAVNNGDEAECRRVILPG